MGCGTGIPAILLQARIGAFDSGAKTVESDNSIGDEVRLQIKRGASTIETTTAQVNTGVSMFLVYTSTVQNGDILCVQVSNNGFSSYDEDCRTIPTPQFEFVPAQQKVKFENCPVLVPNSSGSDTITLNATVTDANGITGTLVISGSRNAINDTDNSINVPVDGTSGSFTYITSMGNVYLTATYNVGYLASKNKDFEISVTDSVSWSSVENDCGIMDGILMDDGTPLTLDDATTFLRKF